MDKAYSRINWANQPSTSTSLGATNLNKIDLALDTVDSRVITLDTSKANQSTVNAMVQSVTLNQTTGVITVTYQNGTAVTYDTKLEKLAVNFSYDSTNQRLVITLDDGTVQYVDMSALITQYEFENSSTVSFSVNSGKVTAQVPDGSITGTKLQPNYLADITVQAQTATAQASIATEAAEDAYAAQLAAEAARDEAEAIAGVGIATSTAIGLVKGGGNVSIAADGTMSVSQVNVDVATDTMPGIVKGGGNVSIAADGTMSVDLSGKISTSDIVQNTTTNNTSKVPSSAVTHDLQQQINNIGSTFENFSVTPSSGVTIAYQNCYKNGNHIFISVQINVAIAIANGTNAFTVPSNCIPSTAISYKPAGISFTSGSGTGAMPVLCSVNTSGVVVCANMMAVTMYGAAINFSYHL